MTSAMQTQQPVTIDKLPVNYNWDHYEKVIQERKKRGLPYSLMINLEDRGRIVATNIVNPHTAQIHFCIPR